MVTAACCSLKVAICSDVVTSELRSNDGQDAMGVVAQREVGDEQGVVIKGAQRGGSGDFQAT